MSVQVVKLERPNPRQEEFLKCEKKYVLGGPEAAEKRGQCGPRQC